MTENRVTIDLAWRRHYWHSIALMISVSAFFWALNALSILTTGGTAFLGVESTMADFWVNAVFAVIQLGVVVFLWVETKESALR